MKHFTLSLFFLGFSAHFVSGEHIQLQTASVTPQMQDTQVVSLPKEAPAVKTPPVTASTLSQGNTDPEVRIWTADDIRRYIRVHGALNTCATFSRTLQNELETLRDDIQSIQDGIRSIVRINNKPGLDAHDLEILKLCYEDCLDKLRQLPKNTAQSAYVDCILWLKTFHGTLEALNNRVRSLDQTLRMLPNTPDISALIAITLATIRSVIEQINRIFNRAQILLPILYEFSQQERQHGWNNIPWL
ncbi:MAG: hypothetical protein LW808_004105 [Verrucomicrobiota bacterium]|nr:MAG: hypothetical protein LW808_004105 [Verrucomicrobiota bacterium]